MTTVMAVCSNKPRPSLQNNHSKGSQHWRRDVWHIAAAFGLTKCGRVMNDWLVIGQIEIDNDCCKQCVRSDAP